MSLILTRYSIFLTIRQTKLSLVNYDNYLKVPLYALLPSLVDHYYRSEFDRHICVLALNLSKFMYSNGSRQLLQNSSLSL